MFRFLSEISLLPNFSYLAKVSTGRQTRFKGVLPPLATIVSLAAVSSAIALGAWLWMGLIATSASFLPILVTTAAAITGFTFLNFWFSREINTFMLSSREVREGFKFDENNPTDLLKLVDHVLAEVNAYLRKIDPNHQDCPRPRICTFSDVHAKVVTIEGRNPGKSALFFSSGCFNSQNTHLNQRHLAALITFELFKIAKHRGVGRTFVQMWTDVLTNFENFRSGNFIGKMFGFLAGPLQFFLLLQRSVSRSYEYEAGEATVKIGRGMDLVDAIDYKVCSTLFEKRTYVELQKDQTAKRRDTSGYNGFFSKHFRSFINWVANNEYAGDDKSGYLILSFLDILVREMGFFVNELFSERPRATRLKDYIRPLLTLDTDKTSAEIAQLYEKDKATNQNLVQDVINRKGTFPTYAPISPEGNGYVKPIYSDHPDYRTRKKNKKRAFKEKINNQEARITSLETRLDVLMQQVEAQSHTLEGYRSRLEAFQIHANGHNGFPHLNGNGKSHSAPSSPSKKKSVVSLGLAGSIDGAPQPSQIVAFHAFSQPAEVGQASSENALPNSSPTPVLSSM